LAVLAAVGSLNLNTGLSPAGGWRIPARWFVYILHIAQPTLLIALCWTNTQYWQAEPTTEVEILGCKQTCRWKAKGCEFVSSLRQTLLLRTSGQTSFTLIF
jgi:hypothetical protein